MGRQGEAAGREGAGRGETVGGAGAGGGGLGTPAGTWHSWRKTQSPPRGNFLGLVKSQSQDSRHGGRVRNTRCAAGLTGLSFIPVVSLLGTYRHNQSRARTQPGLICASKQVEAAAAATPEDSS